jgi:hypothetical protein
MACNMGNGAEFFARYKMELQRVPLMLAPLVSG